MKFIIELADVPIEIQHSYGYIRKLCEDYLVTDIQPTFSVSVSEQDIECEMRMTEYRFSRAICESTCIHRAVTERLVRYGVILIHSAVIAVDGIAYAFLAKSGVGKSTHIRLWRECFGERAVVVNGDKPMFSFANGVLTAHGSPWRGKEGLGANISMPVGAICLLERGAVNRIERAAHSDITAKIFHQVLLPKTAPELDEFMKLLNRIVSSVPFYKLECNMERDAALVAYRGMNPNQNLTGESQ